MPTEAEDNTEISGSNRNKIVEGEDSECHTKCMEGLVYKGDLLSEEATVMSMVDEYSVAPTSQLQTIAP